MPQPIDIDALIRRPGEPETEEERRRKAALGVQGAARAPIDIGPLISRPGDTEIKNVAPGEIELDLGSPTPTTIKPTPSKGIPQADVMPGATGNLAKEYAVEGARYLGNQGLGIVGGQIQMLRHPFATASGPLIAGNIGGMMSLAELITPLDAGNFPGHKPVAEYEEKMRQTIASDAMTPEIAQYASGIHPQHDVRWGLPDLLSVQGPVRLAKTLPGVSKALEKINVPLGKGLSFVGSRAMPKGIAEAGRKVFAKATPPKLLDITNVYLKVKAAGRALPYIEDPSLAPDPVLRQVATALAKARQNDLDHWDELPYYARKTLAMLGNFKGSGRQDLIDTAHELGLLTPRAAEKAGLAGIRPAPFSTEAPDELAKQHVRNVASSLMERFVQYPLRAARDYAVRRTGTRSALAARYIDQPVRRFLTHGVPMALEAGKAEQKALQAMNKNWVLDIVRQVRRDADGEHEVMDRLSKLAFRYMHTGARGFDVMSDLKGRGIRDMAKEMLRQAEELGDTKKAKFARDILRKATIREEGLAAQATGPGSQLSDDMMMLLDKIKKERGDWINEMANSGFFDVKTLQRLRDPNNLMLDVYHAAHNPKAVKFAQAQDAWDNVRAILHQANPRASHAEVEGSLRNLLEMEVAQKFEDDGFKAIPLVKKIRENPILRNVFSNEEYANMLEGQLPDLYGKVDDLQTAIELTGEMLSRHRARINVNQGLADFAHKVGLAVGGDTQPGDWVNIGPRLRIGQLDPRHTDKAANVWVPPAFAKVFDTGEDVAKNMNKLWKAALRSGSWWRAGSTVYSLSMQAGAAFGNLHMASNSGDVFRSEFPAAIAHSVKQSLSVVGRAGLPATDQAAELGLISRGVGTGTASGDLTRVSTDLNTVVKAGQTRSIPPWMQKGHFIPKLGFDPKGQKIRKAVEIARRATQVARDTFQQGDMVFKRAIAELIAGDFDGQIPTATPLDLQNMEKFFGSTDPGRIAADMTANLTQTYERTSPMMQDLGKTGVVGLFGQFPYEANRNFGWAATYTTKFLRAAAVAESPTLKQMYIERAMRHIAGMSVNLRFMAEIGELSEEAFGRNISERKKEAIKDVAIPENDRGPVSILEHKKGMLSYITAGNIEYFKSPRQILDTLGTLAGRLASGKTLNQADEAMMDLAVKLSDDFLQLHQPLRGILETITNQKLSGSPLSIWRDSERRRAQTKLTTSGVGENALWERMRKGLIPGVLPTPGKQIWDFMEWAGAPEEDTTTGRAPYEMTPVKYRSINTVTAMGAAFNQFAEEKNNIGTEIGKIMKMEISNQEKGQRLSEVRDDWYNDFGPRLAREVPKWRRVHNGQELFDAAKLLGEYSTFRALHGDVPDFNIVFGEKIPGNVARHMRRR